MVVRGSSHLLQDATDEVHNDATLDQISHEALLL